MMLPLQILAPFSKILGYRSHSAISEESRNLLLCFLLGNDELKPLKHQVRIEVVCGVCVAVAVNMLLKVPSELSDMLFAGFPGPYCKVTVHNDITLFVGYMCLCTVKHKGYIIDSDL